MAGSTHGNQALALAVGQPGQQIVVTRSLHRSLLLGLVLAGLDPVWVLPEVDPATGLPGPVPVAAVRAALAAHPGACAVFLGDPSYVGTTGDLAGHAAAAHEAGVPLLVDAAWAAHLGFHPDLPPHPLAAGADAMVTSAHKALPAYTQGALVLARTGRLDPAAAGPGVRGHAHHQPGRRDHGQHRRGPGAAGPGRHGPVRPAAARWWPRPGSGCAQVPGLDVLDGPGSSPPSWWCCWPAPARTGNAVEADLIAAGMPVEMADRDTDHPDRDAGRRRATPWPGSPTTLIAAVERHRGAARQPRPGRRLDGHSRTWPSPPRQAFFSPQRNARRATAAVGRVSAELVAPYPPGVPVLAPGRGDHGRGAGRAARGPADGGRIAYAADPTLATFQVIAQEGDQPTVR